MNTINIKGRIHFDLPDITKKHINQSEWKRLAMVMIDGEICEYYSWFIKKRFNITLAKPIRNAHISFINDKISDIMVSNGINENEAYILWDKVKERWEGKEVELVIDIDPRTNGKHWWLNVPHENRQELLDIRKELGLDKPFFGIHLTLGRTRDGIHKEHCEYIHECIKNGFIK